MFSARGAEFLQRTFQNGVGSILRQDKRIHDVLAADLRCFRAKGSIHLRDPVANAAMLQLAAAGPNFEILEIMYADVRWRKDVTDGALEYADGYMTISLISPAWAS